MARRKIVKWWKVEHLPPLNGKHSYRVLLECGHRVTFRRKTPPSELTEYACKIRSCGEPVGRKKQVYTHCLDCGKPLNDYDRKCEAAVCMPCLNAFACKKAGAATVDDLKLRRKRNLPDGENA